MGETTEAERNRRKTEEETQIQNMREKTEDRDNGTWMGDSLNCQVEGEPDE